MTEQKEHHLANHSYERKQASLALWPRVVVYNREDRAGVGTLRLGAAWTGRPRPHLFLRQGGSAWGCFSA